MIQWKRRVSPILILLLLTPTALFGLPQADRLPPDKQRVARELDRLKAEETEALREAARWEHAFEDVGVGMKEGAFYVRLLLVSAVLLVAAFLIYLLIRFIVARTYSRRRAPDRRAAAEARRGFSPAHLVRLEAAGRFNEAVLYLHRLSIEMLQERKILVERNLTNGGILDRLRDQSTAAAFRTIAGMSERVLFDRFVLTREGYAPCRAAFDGTFGGQA
jgi:hypothetical protein